MNTRFFLLQMTNDLSVIACVDANCRLIVKIWEPFCLSWRMSYVGKHLNPIINIVSKKNNLFTKILYCLQFEMYNQEAMPA